MFTDMTLSYFRSRCVACIKTPLNMHILQCGVTAVISIKNGKYDCSVSGACPGGGGQGAWPPPLEPRKQLGTKRYFLDSDLSGPVVRTSSRHVITHGLTKGNSIGVEIGTV